MEELILKELKKINTTVEKIQEDVGVLKQDVSVLKQDVSVLKQDMAEVKEKVTNLEKRVTKLEIGQARLEEKVDRNARDTMKTLDIILEAVDEKFLKQDQRIERLEKAVFAS